jgi:glycosyltransferase involved in cell wall biosynthesis
MHRSPGRQWQPFALLSHLASFWQPQLGRLRQYPPRPLRLPVRYNQTPCPANPPAIAVVTPSFQQGAFLGRTLRSVLDQSYPRLEYVVQDGGSRDESLAVLERHGARLHSWESTPDAGQADALNRGFARTTGPIMAYLNADDILLPGTLAHVAGFFATHPAVDVVYGHRILIDEHDQEIGRWVLPSHSDLALVWQDFVPQETLFWRRRLWERAGGGVATDYRFALDWELLLRFRAAGAHFARLPRFLGAFRVHADQKTARQLHDIGRSEIERLHLRQHGRVLSEADIARRVRPYLRRHLIVVGLYRLGLLRY